MLYAFEKKTKRNWCRSRSICIFPIRIFMEGLNSIENLHVIFSKFSNILKITEGGGIFCSSNSDPSSECLILSTHGCFSGIKGQPVGPNLPAEMLQDFKQAIRERRHIFSKHHSVFFSKRQISRALIT